MKRIHARKTISVIDPYGELIRERVLLNTPWGELFPDQQLVIVDHRPKPGQRFKKPERDEFAAGVVYQGVTYKPYFWGSSIKTLQVCGAANDFLVESGLQTLTEQSVYGTRYLLASNGGFYGAVRGKLKIKIVPEGTMVTRHAMVSDGHGVISSKVANLGMSSASPIHLGQMRPSYMFSQWLPDSCWKEIQPMIDKRLKQVMDDEFNPFQFALAMNMLSKDKLEVAELDESMILHPFITGVTSKSTKDIWFRLATSAPLKIHGQLVVPYPTETVECPGFEGRHLVFRYPLDGPTIQALDMPEGNRYLEDVEVLQVTIASRELFAKGCLSITDEKIGADIVICAKDIKMGPRETVTLSDAVVSFIQRYKGAAGVNMEWASGAMGADADGDMIGIVPVSKKIWDAVSKIERLETKKITKTKTPVSYESRITLALDNMRNLVGAASNTLSSVLAVGDLEKVSMDLGFNSPTSMLTAINFGIKCGTDGFKTFIDMTSVEKSMYSIQGHFNHIYGSLPPWLKWMRDDAAFVTDIPTGIPDAFQGMIARIARHALPTISEVYTRAVPSLPVSYFREWGHEVPALKGFAMGLKLWFNSVIRNVNLGDGDEVAVFKQECQDHASALCEKFRIDSLAMANALWWEAHDGSGNGSVVFYMFPDECRRIIMEHKAKSVSVTKVLGLRHQVDFDDLQLTVRIEDFHQLKNNKMVIRKAVIGKVIGQRQSPGYPKDFLAIVDVNSLQPAVGKYLGRIRKGAGSSHVLELSPLS